MKDEEAEPWMRFYNAELAHRKRAELNLEVDGEMVYMNIFQRI